MTSRFLTAEWRDLVMLNYEIDPGILAGLVPAGTELDLWQGRALVSVVGFHFRRTRVMGVAIPGHSNFEEVNLRFYVRREGPEGWRRGVVFVKEIVPRFAIAWVARALYNENYVALPMRHAIVGRSRAARSGASAISGGTTGAGATWVSWRAARREFRRPTRKRPSLPSTTGATSASATAGPSSTRWSIRSGG